jgi:parvulin-like peptidyl-prolyl isomerase
MRTGWAALVMTLVVLSELPAHSATAPGAKARAAKPANSAPADGAVALVGSRRVMRSEFDSRTDRAREDFRAHYGTDVPEEMDNLFRRQVLTGLVNLDLLVLEAQRRGITATVAEADEILKRNPFFNPGGKFDAEKFAAVKAANSPTYRQTIGELRLEIAGQKLQTRLQGEHTPSDSLLRDVAIRSIGQADLEYFLVDARQFDGHFPEPRETDLLDYYRAHAAEFRRGERAVMSVIFVDAPGLSDSARTAPGALKAWDARLRTRADSALAALRKGAAFGQVADHFSGRRTGEAVLADNFPGYWQGTPEQRSEVFRSAPGGYLAQPVASHPGYLVVRVDSVMAGGQVPLADVSNEIRRRLRADARVHREDREFATLYARYADSLSAPAVRVRYASADTAAMDSGEPTEADLDRYFRGHLADYSTFDARTNSIHSYTLDDVRDDVRRRWRYDRRAQMARTLAEGLTRAWSAGKRDAELEKQATLLRDVGPLPVGAPVDTGLAARAVADSLRERGAVARTGSMPYPRGFVVFSIYEVMPRYRPTLEQARPQLRVIAERQHADQDRAGARALYDRDPAAWKRGSVVHFSRFVVPMLQPIDVPLTRTEVANYRREHAEDYSAPELMHARHILISPTGPGDAADRVAHARIDSIAKAIKAGADFGTVARQVTDDPATQAAGGDLGTFGHGAMLPTFEKAAFKLRPGQISAPVRTREGYHLIQCVEYWPLEERPLAWIYSQIGFDCAHDKADTLCAHRADSLFRSLRSPEQAATAGRRFGWPIDHNVHMVGDHAATAELKPYLIALENVTPGHLYPGIQLIRGFGYAITWVDSITPPETPKWEEATDRVLETYRRDASQRAVTAKLAELDSLGSRGWSFDSLATLWGGKVSESGLKPSDGLREMTGTRPTLDSLVFGTRRGPSLKPGEVSGWSHVPYGYLKLKLLQRLDPAETDIQRRMEADRRASLERSLKPVFDELTARYGVQILDPVMKATVVPPLPPGPPGLP